MKKMILFILVCLSVSVFATDERYWSPSGNNQSVNMNYQIGSNDVTLGLVDHIHYADSRQPMIFDFAGDGGQYYFVSYSGYSRVYTFNSSGFVFLDEIMTGYNTPMTADVVDFDGTGTLEYIAVQQKTSNTTEQYFVVYSFDGTSISIEHEFILTSLYNLRSQMRCLEWDGDSDIDCIMVMNNKTQAWSVSNPNYFVGFNKSSVSAETPSFNFSIGHVPATDVPEVIDMEVDGDREALFPLLETGAEGFVIFNISGIYLQKNISTTSYYESVARWYNRDGGDYEVLTATSGFNSPMTISLYSYIGLLIYDTSTDCPVQNCIYGDATVTASLGFTSINNGDIYALNSCKGAFVGGEVFTYVCRFDKDGTSIQSNSVTSDYYSFDGRTVFADMLGDAKPEFINNRGVIDLSGNVQYFIFGNVTDYGYCLPFDFDADSKLDLICTLNSANTSLFSAYGSGGSLENFQPSIYSVVLDKYVLREGESVSVTINAYDSDNDNIYYGIDCDTDGLETSIFTVPLLNKFSCSYNYNGSKRISAYVNDDSHGGSTASIDEWANRSVMISVGSEDDIPLCFSPFILCDDFNYIMPLVFNKWYVSSMYVFGLDTGLTPAGGRVKLPDTDSYHLVKYYQQNKYGIITVTFNASFNTSMNDDVEFIVGNTKNPNMDSVHQVLIRFMQNKIYSVYLENAVESVNLIGTYNNNTVDNYRIQIFYDRYDIFGNSTNPKLRNTYDVYKSGVLLERGRNFYHGSTPVINHPNVTDDFISYSDYISFTSELTNFTLDDVYVYTGTDPTVDNLNIFDNPQPFIEWSTVNKYMGCILINGDPNLLGKFDCNYKVNNCHECCGYVDGVFKVVKTSCIYTKSARQYTDKFQKWVFNNMWIFMIVVFIVVVWFMLTRRKRSN